MADSFVQVPPDSTGKMIDNTSLTVGANTVYRQRGNICSPSAAAGIAEVKNAVPANSDYGLLVREVTAVRTTVTPGQVSIATTATQLSTVSSATVMVKSLQTNSTVIWVGGDNTVAANTGYELQPGEAVTLNVSNANKIWAISPAGAQTVCFIATN